MSGLQARGWGSFVVFEGGEGSGKSTQAAILAERLDAVLTRQPGGTDLGEQLRRILLDGAAGEVVDRAEALLMAADRAQHVELVIRPALEAGRHVVCDRYTGSSVAYQGHGRGLDPIEVERISAWAVGDVEADLVLLLSVEESEAMRRTGAPRDRIEAAGDGFHQRVQQGYEAQAEADPQRWVALDGSGTVEEVAQRVVAAVNERLGLDL